MLLTYRLNGCIRINGVGGSKIDGSDPTFDVDPKKSPNIENMIYKLQPFTILIKKLLRIIAKII